MALTRPKTPKKEQSGSPPGNNNRDRERQNDSLRSPITSDAQHSHSRSSSKTPIHTTSSAGSDHASNVDMNSSNVKIPQSPLPPSDKLNHHSVESLHNNNGVNNNHNQQQFPSHTINGPEKILPSPSVDRKDFDFSKVNGEFL